jgi:hypothetical protein
VRTRNAKLAGWLALVGSLAALNYASRFTSGKPPPDTLYRYDTAISGVIFYAITLALVLWIARGLSREELALRRPRSWPRALGFTLVVLIALLAAEVALEAILHATQEQGLEPKHWSSPSAASASRCSRGSERSSPSREPRRRSRPTTGLSKGSPRSFCSGSRSRSCASAPTASTPGCCCTPASTASRWPRLLPDSCSMLIACGVQRSSWRR